MATKYQELTAAYVAWDGQAVERSELLAKIPTKAMRRLQQYMDAPTDPVLGSGGSFVPAVALYWENPEVRGPQRFEQAGADQIITEFGDGRLAFYIGLTVHRGGQLSPSLVCLTFTFDMPDKNAVVIRGVNFGREFSVDLTAADPYEPFAAGVYEDLYSYLRRSIWDRSVRPKIGFGIGA